MTQPPEEYFATPGPNPLTLPEGYVDDRPPELVILVDELAAMVDDADVADLLALLNKGRRP